MAWPHTHTHSRLPLPLLLPPPLACAQVWVYRRRYESGGRLWQQMFVQVMTGLYMSQAVMLGLLGLKKFVYAPLMLPAVALTLAFHAGAGERARGGGGTLKGVDTLPGTGSGSP